MNLTENAKKVLQARYCRDGESPEDVFKRVAKVIGKVNNNEDEYLSALENLDFLPNSPCIRNAGYSNSMKACYVLGIEDNMSSIFKALHDAGIIFKEGGGVGYNFSNLREKNSPISTGGTSSGVISFLKIFNSIVEAVKQGGFRRGACMGVLDYDHPEILDFITIKLRSTEMQNFNLSVMLDSEFMQKVKEGGNIYLRARQDRRKIVSKSEARDLFDIISYSAWMNGDPGVLFKENINKDNPFKDPIVACNPCAEQFLYSGEACCLGSINLSHCINKDGSLNERKLSKLIELGTKFLLDVNKLNEFQLDECYKQQYKYNRIGLGIMGFADALMKMGIYYDSEETLKVIDVVGKLMVDESKKIASSSASTLSIAPTGTLSILANCSSGIEPIFDINYKRSLTDDIGEISESRANKYIRTAHEISPEWHLKILARWQKWIDNGVSKTINLPNDATIQQVKDIYMKAWEWGCKGVTVYRDGSRGEQVYYSTKCDGESCHL